MTFVGVWISRIVSFVFFFSFATIAAPGDIDLSFNAETGVSGWVYAVTPLSDGKVLIGGDFTNVQSAFRPSIARLNADGSIDNSFRPSLSNNPTVLSIAVQSDGKTVLGGHALSKGWISRLNADGSLDTSFSPPNLFGQEISKVIVQPNGKIIVGGLFQKNGGAPGDAITRLNTDGSVDSNFNLTAFAGYYASPAITLQADGKLLVSVVGPPNRFNEDGSVDSSFLAPQFDYSWVDSVAAQSDGKVLVGGLMRVFEHGNVVNVLRLNNDGSLDTNYVQLQRGNLDVRSIVLDKDGSALIGGSTYNGAELLRLSSNGLVKTNFGIPGGASTDIQSIAVDPSENIYVGGAFAWPHGIANVGRLRQDSSLDLSFQPGFSLSGAYVPNVALNAEGKPIAALTAYDRQMGGVAVQRFSLDGSVDKDFSMATLRGSPTFLKLQKDGKVLVASQYVLGDAFAPDFKRLNSDGTVDQSFKAPFTTGVIKTALQLPDGKILIAGSFTTLYGLAADRVARLNSDGSVDRTFQSLAFLGSPAVTYDIPRSLAVQADGKILVGFQLESCDCGSFKRMTVIRLNADGSYDPTFDSSGIVPLWVNTMFVQPDGKILVGGFQFAQASPNATPRHGIVRLNADGSLDTTFNTPLTIGADVRVIAVERSGKIVINSAYEVLRLNSDGSLDPSFKTVRADDGGQYTTDLALATDGNIYFSDSFSSVSHVPRPKLARLFGTSVPLRLQISPTGNSGGLTLDWSDSAMHLQSAPSVNGPFTDVLNAKSPWKPSSDERSLFFRVRSD